jgi:PAS domain S-box-containing protein
MHSRASELLVAYSRAWGMGPMTSDVMTPRPATEMSAGVLQAAFDAAPAPVCICDEDGLFLAANHAFVTMLRTPLDDILGRPYLHFVHPEQRSESLASYFRSVVAAASLPPRATEHGELRLLVGDGSQVWVSVAWTTTAPDAAGRQYSIVHLRDISQRRRAQSQLTDTKYR